MKKIECAPKLGVLINTDKRIKIIVGGRGSTKSTFVADYVLSAISQGQLWCCGREFQNSIDESVHRLMLDEVERLEFEGITHDNNHIYHESGGRNFYKGLGRNTRSIKSMLSGVDGLWIEEGDSLSDDTLRHLTASLRLSAADAEKVIAGEDIKMPEVWITLNRGSAADPISKKWLARAEESLARTGYYEDDNIMIVEINWTDIPRRWFLASGLESERADDEENMSTAEYDHKWGGKYSDTVENAIIKPEWFDAAIDAHKLPHLKAAFEPRGIVKAAHDPSDTGSDRKGLCIMHGSIFKMIEDSNSGEIDDGCFWAMETARDYGADWFIWDGDGMGAGLKNQVASYFSGSRTQSHMFKGSLAGRGQDNAEEEYMPVRGGEGVRHRYADVFLNNRSQYYIRLANRFYNTYRCVVKGEYVDPDDMVSIDSDGVEHMELLRAEVCRIPRKKTNSGLIKIMSKDEMKKVKIASPNMADCMMMAICEVPDAYDEDWDEWEDDCRINDTRNSHTGY